MENRIKIGDVWYVREEQPIEEIKMEVTTFDGRVFESDLYCYEATRIYDDKNLLSPGGTLLVYDTACDIEITDKRVKPWKVHNLDNPLWYIGVLENNPESMVEAREMFCERGIIEFRIFIRDLISVGWLKGN